MGAERVGLGVGGERHSPARPCRVHHHSCGCPCRTASGARDAAHGRSREATAADPAFREFRDCALGYDDGGVPGRILAGHERWLASLRIPVLRVDGGRPLPDLLDHCLEGIGAAPLGG